MCVFRAQRATRGATAWVRARPMSPRERRHRQWASSGRRPAVRPSSRRRRRTPPCARTTRSWTRGRRRRRSTRRWPPTAPTCTKRRNTFRRRWHRRRRSSPARFSPRAESRWVFFSRTCCSCVSRVQNFWCGWLTQRRIRMSAARG